MDKEDTSEIRRKINCDTQNCIYMIQCQKYDEKYIGQTGRLIRFRIADHRGYIQNQVTSKATGAHWNQPGHSLADLKVAILEPTRNNSEEYRKEREKYLINKFDTYYRGLNRQK